MRKQWNEDHNHNTFSDIFVSFAVIIIVNSFIIIAVIVSWLLYFNRWYRNDHNWHIRVYHHKFRVFIDIMHTGFSVLTTECMKMTVFWVYVSYSLVEFYQRFRGNCYLHYEDILLLIEIANISVSSLNFYQSIVFFFFNHIHWLQLSSVSLQFAPLL